MNPHEVVLLSFIFGLVSLQLLSTELVQYSRSSINESGNGLSCNPLNRYRGWGGF